PPGIPPCGRRSGRGAFGAARAALPSPNQGEPPMSGRFTDLDLEYALRYLREHPGCSWDEAEQYAVTHARSAAATLAYYGCEVGGERTDYGRHAELHEHPEAPLRAVEVVEGWISQLGPTLPHTDLLETYARIQREAQEQGFEEIPPLARIQNQWQKT